MLSDVTKHDVDNRYETTSLVVELFESVRIYELVQDRSKKIFSFPKDLPRSLPIRHIVSIIKPL